MMNEHLTSTHFFDLDFSRNILPGMIQDINIREINFQTEGAGPHFDIEGQERTVLWLDLQISIPLFISHGVY